MSRPSTSSVSVAANAWLASAARRRARSDGVQKSSTARAITASGATQLAIAKPARSHAGAAFWRTIVLFWDGVRSNIGGVLVESGAVRGDEAFERALAARDRVVEAEQAAVVVHHELDAE